MHAGEHTHDPEQATLGTFRSVRSDSERSDVAPGGSGGAAAACDAFNDVSETLCRLESLVPGAEQRSADAGMTTKQRLKYTEVRLEVLRQHLEQLLVDDPDLRYID